MTGGNADDLETVARGGGLGGGIHGASAKLMLRRQARNNIAVTKRINLRFIVLPSLFAMNRRISRFFDATDAIDVIGKG
ncbi:MAG TPA: hypothetical protein VKV03_01000 [Candidatus Binataceae bacterium]|nr:hypothetical protein [Candidatus Binataceae bacterium]